MKKILVLFTILFLLGTSTVFACNLNIKPSSDFTIITEPDTNEETIEIVIEQEDCELAGFTPDFSATIECIELMELIQSKTEFCLLDVRSESEWNTGYIQGAILIPHKEIENNLHKLPSDKNALIVIYCKSGLRSGAALETLKGLGYTNLTHLIQGTLGWSFEGYPLVKPEIK